MYQFKSRVRFSEVDSQLNMTLPSIINYFQDCSTFSLRFYRTGYRSHDGTGLCLDSFFLADHY